MDTGKHISETFNQELESVQKKVLSMGGLVERQLSDALKAVETGDKELARQVKENDKKVNGLEVSIDEDCIRIIAKRQPAASDLRLITAVFKTIADLERMGDEIKRLAKVAHEDYHSDQKPLLVSLENLGRQALFMLHQVLDAFARMDLEAAYNVHKQDADIDRQYEALTRQLMTYMMEDPRSIPKIMAVFLSARSLERIGDRCQNIAEYIIYFVKGKDVRHVSIEDMEATVQGDKNK